MLLLYRSLCKLLRQERPDIIHSFLFVSNVLGPFAAKKARVPAAIASRGRMGIEWKAHFLHRLAQRAADRRTDLIICKTEAIAAEIERVRTSPPPTKSASFLMASTPRTTAPNRIVCKPGNFSRRNTEFPQPIPSSSPLAI